MVIDWTSISPSNVKHPESSRSWKAVRVFHGNSYKTSSRGCSLWANRMPKRLKFTVSPPISLYKQRACKIVQSQMRQISSRPRENSHMVIFTLPVGYCTYRFFLQWMLWPFLFQQDCLLGGENMWGQFPHIWPTIIPVLGSIIQYGHQPILVGGLNPSEKYWSVGMIIPNIWKNMEKLNMFQTTSQFCFTAHVSLAKRNPRSTLHTTPQQQRVCTFRAVRDQLISCYQLRPFTDLYKP